MKILFSSQDFAYGPTSQMFSFLKHLLIFGCTDEIYIKNNSATNIFFKNFMDENSYKNMFLIDDIIGDYDLYIGFYDPDIIIEGKSKSKKTIFICNLTFLWNDSFFDTINNQNIIFLLGKKINNHHQKIALGYHLADKVFIRNTDGIDMNSKLYKNIQHKTEFIGPIIYPKIYSNGQKKHCIIQLGGQINPITPESFYSTYFKLISKICQNISGKKKVIVHPKLIKIAKEYFSSNDNYETISTLGQSQYQKLLSEGNLLLSPFGINTFFESSYFDIPTYILPEQHLGHIKSLIQYLGDIELIKDQSFLLYNIEKYNLSYENEKDFIDFLEKKYEKILKDDFPFPLIKNKVSNIIQFLNLKSSINYDIEKLIHEIID